MLTAANLHKTYGKGHNSCEVLRGLDLEVQPGEFLSIVGQSGCGKSTLLHLLGPLDRPDEGDIRLDGRRIDNLPSRERDTLRNQTFGFIFQFYHLLPEFSAIENVLVPRLIQLSLFGSWMKLGTLLERAEQLLERVRLLHRLTPNPPGTTGGEQQRAATART